MCRWRAVAEEAARRLLSEKKLRRGTCHGKPVGALIAVEGLDGSGQTTVASALVHFLQAILGDPHGVQVTYTKEPTGGPVGQLLWGVIKGWISGVGSPDLLYLLFTADRLYHLYEDTTVAGGLVKGVAQALAEGIIVVTDRYKYSTLAYQLIGLPGGRGLDPGLAWRIQADLAPPPHILVYLDLPPEESIKRIVLRSERHLYEYHRKLARVRANFREIIQRLQGEPEYPRVTEVGEPETPTWYHYVPRSDCLYRRGIGLPRVIVVEEQGKTLEEVIEEVLNRVLEELINLGVLAAEKRDQERL